METNDTTTAATDLEIRESLSSCSLKKAITTDSTKKRAFVADKNDTISGQKPDGFSTELTDKNGSNSTAKAKSSRVDFSVERINQIA